MASLESNIDEILQNLREKVNERIEEQKKAREEQVSPLPVVLCLLCFEPATVPYISRQHGLIVVYDVCKSHVAALRKQRI